MKCTGKFFSLTFLHRNKCFHCFSLPGILVPASEFPVHVPVPNKYARIPVPANYPGTGSAQPLPLSRRQISTFETLAWVDACRSKRIHDERQRAEYQPNIK